jgi:predicted flap endonuclease-1-like 5' DNA nuclease
MPYTLSMTALWLALAGLLGGIIGWLLRNAMCGKHTAALKAAPAVNTGDADKLRHRIANLEPAVAERDKLKVQVGQLEADLKAAKAVPVAAVAAAAPVAAFAGIQQADHDVVVGERDGHAKRIAELEADLAACRAKTTEHETKIQGLMSDLSSVPVTPDNLQLIVGVGPVIEKILNDGGVFTFDQMVAADVKGLQDILPDMQDARVEKENWIPQATAFLDAKRRGVDPATVARDNQVK